MIGKYSVRPGNLRDVEGLPPSLHSITSATAAVSDLSFGSYKNIPILASSSLDRTVRLWDISNADVQPALLAGHTDWVRSVAFKGDGGTLASGSADGEIRLWFTPEILADLVLGRITQALLEEEGLEVGRSMQYGRTTADEMSPHSEVVGP